LFITFINHHPIVIARPLCSPSTRSELRTESDYLTPGMLAATSRDLIRVPRHLDRTRRPPGLQAKSRSIVPPPLNLTSAGLQMQAEKVNTSSLVAIRSTFLGMEPPCSSPIRVPERAVQLAGRPHSHSSVRRWEPDRGKRPTKLFDDHPSWSSRVSLTRQNSARKGQGMIVGRRRFVSVSVGSYEHRSPEALDCHHVPHRMRCTAQCPQLPRTTSGRSVPLNERINR
jgi:hypothetical protein